MPEYPNIKLLENLSEETDDLNLKFREILHGFQHYLNIEPVFPSVELVISKNNFSDGLEDAGIFDIGVNRFIQNDKLVIEVNQNWVKFLSFISLREIYNNFIPQELRSVESVQLVINQLIIAGLSKHPLINEWRGLIRQHLEQYDLLSVGFNRLSAFDRLEKFFKLQTTEATYDPARFFFQYLRRNVSVISDKGDDIYNIFLVEFTNYVSKLMINDENVETIRCLIEIFYDVEYYQNLLSYHHYFQEFKENGKIETELSLSKFIKNMDWVNKYSCIAPSYLLNWKTINVCLIAIFFRFNPLLEIAKIYKILEQLPFFTGTKIFRNGFAFDLAGYFLIPRIYLDDFLKFIQKSERNGYIIESYCLSFNHQSHNVNLNYFRKFAQKHPIINPNHRHYDKKHEIEFKMDYGQEYHDTEFSILDFLILDRIREFSTGGFGFERKGELISTLKNDLLNEIITQRTLIKDLNTILNTFHASVDLKTAFLQFLRVNKKFGFFSIKSMLKERLTLLDLINTELANNPAFRSVSQFQGFVENTYISRSIEENILLSNQKTLKTLFRDIVHLHFESGDLYRKVLERYNNFHEFFASCYNLKLFDLNAMNRMLEDANLIDAIYETKDKKLKNSYEKYKLYKITSQEIEETLDKFLNNNPPIIQPILINTMPIDKFGKDFIQIVLRDSPEIQEIFKKIKLFFSRALIINTKESLTNKNLFFIEISTQNIKKEEKEQLFSILYNNFKESIILGRSYSWAGMFSAISGRNFYDFDRKEFFYTKDLYEQFFLYVQNILGKPLPRLQENPSNYQEKVWYKNKNVLNLVKRIDSRISKEHPDFNVIPLNKLLHLHLNLKNRLLDTEKFISVKQEYFFMNYIKSIKFIPAIQYFGLGQYFLYMYPTDIEEIDIKLLLMNTFQKISNPICIGNSNSFFIKYLLPYRNPNLTYIHWLAKSKKILREYCGFFIKKVYQIFHFNYNLSSEGWVYSADKFKGYMQNILFNPNYEVQVPEIKEFTIGEKKDTRYFEPNSPEFESLTQIHDWHAIDMKSYLGTTKHSKINHITSLLKKNLIFPYLSLKNLELTEELHVIIPNLKPELNDKLIKIFSFFNLGFMHEIEGEAYIHGFDKEIQFENGLYIKLFFPPCELNEFFRVFDLLFEYLEIKHYLILSNLVSAKNLLKSVYGSLEFLKSYNPLKNLKWNEKDKIWMNHKLFSQEFEKQYPPLLEK